MKILTGGCSFTAQTDNLRVAWPNHLKDFDVTNTAEMASGNGIILDRIISKLDGSYNCCVVMWSSPYRVEFLLNNETFNYEKIVEKMKDTHSISNYTQTNVPHKVGLGSNWLRIGGNYGIWKYNVEEVDEMLENYFKYIHNLEYQFIQTLKSIILLQNYCEVNKIQLINTCWNNIFDLVGELDDRHSSSNMFLTNDVIKKLKIGSSIQIPKTDLYSNALHWYNKIDWSKWLFYETGFYKRGGLGEFATLECGEENLKTGSHPKTSSQIKWAKFITEYINETIIKP